MVLFIGVDGGATKTHAVVVDENGKVVGQGEGPSSNYQNVGSTNARSAIAGAVKMALENGSCDGGSVRSISCMLAGVCSDADKGVFDGLAGAMSLPQATLRVDGDQVGALIGGIGGSSKDGLVLISGTGCAVFGRRHSDGATARAAGWGHRIDTGAAYDIALAGVRAVFQSEDGLGPATILTNLVLNKLGLGNVREIINWLYSGERTVAEIAAVALCVHEAADSGDAVAYSILAHAADSLAESIWTVSKRLGFTLKGDEESQDTKTFPVVLVGSTIEKGTFFRALTVQAILARVPNARPQFPTFDSAIGAAIHAAESEGFANPLLNTSPADTRIEVPKIYSSEQENILTKKIDTASCEDLVTIQRCEDRRAVKCVDQATPELVKALDEMSKRVNSGGRIIYVGAGTPGRLGVLDASEMPPTFDDDTTVIGVIAGGSEAIVRSIENAEDNEEAGFRAVNDLLVCEKDCIVAVTSSGRTPYCVGSLKSGREKGALTIAVVCNMPSVLVPHSDITIFTPTGPEVVTGSTRMKAGTAQKVVLNLLSTGCMIRKGKVFGNLMVDVRQVNAKLVKRAARIVSRACSVSESEAVELLEKCDQKIKIAIVHYLGSVSPSEASEALLANAGVVARALASLKK